MGEEITVTKIECVRDAYQVDIWLEDSKRGHRLLVRKDALLAMLCVAEKGEIARGNYQLDFACPYAGRGQE